MRESRGRPHRTIRLNQRRVSSLTVDIANTMWDALSHTLAGWLGIAGSSNDSLNHNYDNTEVKTGFVKFLFKGLQLSQGDLTALSSVVDGVAESFSNMQWTSDNTNKQFSHFISTMIYTEVLVPGQPSQVVPGIKLGLIDIGHVDSKWVAQGCLSRVEHERVNISATNVTFTGMLIREAIRPKKQKIFDFLSTIGLT